MTALIWDVIRFHKLSLHAFVSLIRVELYDIFPHKEALFISVDNVFEEITMTYIYVLISECQM